MYGRTFELESAKNHGIDHKVVGYGKAGSYTKQKGMLSYYEVLISSHYNEPLIFGVSLTHTVSNSVINKNIA